MAAETGFLIDETFYELPSLDSFTMDEAQILYDYSGLTLEDFVDADEADKKFKNPGLLRALMHVAYQRGNPRMNTSRVKTLVGAASLVSAMEQLAEGTVAAEDDAGPPVSTLEPAESSQTRPDDSSESSGNPSPSDSAAPVAPLVPITAGSSPRSESLQEISVP